MPSDPTPTIPPALDDEGAGEKSENERGKSEADVHIDQDVQPESDDPKMDLLETAWGIIANANEGNWDAARPEWKAAAERWRDNYHAILDEYLSARRA